MSVLAIFEWDSAERAMAFVNDPMVRNAMEHAGVLSEPLVRLHETDLPAFMKAEPSSGVSQIDDKGFK